MLSSNKESTIYLESLADGMDFQKTLDRSTFEIVAHDVIEKIGIPIKYCMNQLRLKSENITAIELLGGGIRVPRV